MRDEMEKIFSCNNVNKYANDKAKTHILKDVSIDISTGEYVSVMGPSGSGKSSLLYALTGIDESCQGDIFFKDNDMSQFTEEEKSSMRLNYLGFVFQRGGLHTGFNIIDNIALPGYLLESSSKNEIEKKCRVIMSKLGIERLATRSVSDVSGGELQRAAIARALINSPEALVADEPTGAVNSSVQQEILNIFAQQHQEGMTVVLSTHSIKVAAATDRIIYICDGEIKGEYINAKCTDDSVEQIEQKINNWLKRFSI